jgi:hypothetical protein
MSSVSRGFRGRQRPSVELPPGQYLVQGPGRAWLDLRGLTWPQLPVPEQP